VGAKGWSLRFRVATRRCGANPLRRRRVQRTPCSSNCFKRISARWT